VNPVAYICAMSALAAKLVVSVIPPIMVHTSCAGRPPNSHAVKLKSYDTCKSPFENPRANEVPAPDEMHPVIL
jgi:hypothetical protein